MIRFIPLLLLTVGLATADAQPWTEVGTSNDSLGHEVSADATHWLGPAPEAIEGLALIVLRSTYPHPVGDTTPRFDEVRTVMAVDCYEEQYSAIMRSLHLAGRIVRSTKLEGPDSIWEPLRTFDVDLFDAACGSR